MAYESDTQDLPPVTNWTKDWDWFDDQWGANAIDIWNDIRKECPVATTERYADPRRPSRPIRPTTTDIADSCCRRSAPKTSTRWKMRCERFVVR